LHEIGEFDIAGLVGGVNFLAQQLMKELRMNGREIILEEF
jgi:hypothetical protein